MKRLEIAIQPSGIGVGVWRETVNLYDAEGLERTVRHTVERLFQGLGLALVSFEENPAKIDDWQTYVAVIGTGKTIYVYCREVEEE